LSLLEFDYTVIEEDGRFRPYCEAQEKFLLPTDD